MQRLQGYSKGGLSIEIFAWKSHGEIKYTSDKKNTSIELGNGEPQIQRTRVHPIVTWEFTVSDVAKDSLVPIQQFHDARFGSFEKFLWTDKFGTQHTVRFNNDTQEITEIPGWDDDGILKILAYKTEVQLRKVWTK